MSTLRTASIVVLALVGCGGPVDAPPGSPLPVPADGGAVRTCPPTDDGGGVVGASASFGFRSGLLQSPARSANARVSLKDDVFLQVDFAAPVAMPYTVTVTPVGAALLPVIEEKTARGFSVAALWLAGTIGATVQWHTVSSQDFDLVVVH